ncbi:MAG TPA: methionyl-tRNA formyltransferase [Mycobacteriales bacterium]|nr:methionyl-tRNA formyltransferase [Mycobacteriales bacterium]
MRLVFAGTPAVAVPALDTILAAPRHEVLAVLTRPDAPAGRGRAGRPSPVRVRAEQAGLEVLTPRRPGDTELLSRLTDLAPDCCPVVAYGALLPPAALDIPPRGWINLHFSLLPAWRGAAPVQHALLAGDDVTGASTFRIEEGLDTGPVYGVVTAEIGPRETAGELLDRLARIGAELLVATLDGIEDGRLSARPQPLDGVSLAPKLGVEDARIRWPDPAPAVDRRIRACTPAPGAWTTYAGRRIKLAPVELTASSDLDPGQLRVTREAVLVGTGSLDVQLGGVQPEGRRAMAAEAWARGARPGPGDRFR